MPTLTIAVPAGTYDFNIDGEPDDVTVPTLTAGSIVQTSPSIGDTLTVTGSNETASGTYQWQESEDGSTGWTDIADGDEASLNTTGVVTDDYFVRRVVSDGAQTAFTAAVQVAAVGAGYTALYESDFASFGSDTGWATESDIQQLFTENGSNTATIIAATDIVTLASAAGFAAIGIAYDGTISANQKVVFVYDSTAGTGNKFLGGFVRGAASSNDLNGYLLQMRPHGTTSVQLQSVAAGTATDLETAYTLPSAPFQGQRFELEVNVVGGDHILTARAQLDSGSPDLSTIFSHNLGSSPTYTSGVPGIRSTTQNAPRTNSLSYVEFGEFA